MCTVFDESIQRMVFLVLVGKTCLIKLSSFQNKICGNIKLFQALEHSAQKMKLSSKVFFSKFDQIRSDLVIFTEEILNGKLHSLCSDSKNSLVGGL